MINFKNHYKKLFYITIALVILPLFLIISASSLLHLYDMRELLLHKLGHGHHVEKRFLVNPLTQSDRQIPPKDINDLKINKNSNVIGQWTAPVDWNVVGLHSILLPDETVMTFGSYAIDKKESGKDIRSNKKITVTH